MDPAREEDGRERARARRKTPVGRKETQAKREYGEEDKEKRGKGRGEERLICEVNVSPKVGFCQVQPVRPREPERYVYVCIYSEYIRVSLFSLSCEKILIAVVYQKCYILKARVMLMEMIIRREKFTSQSLLPSVSLSAARV